MLSSLLTPGTISWSFFLKVHLYKKPLHQLLLVPQIHGEQRILPRFTEHLQFRLSSFHSHLAFKDISAVTTVDDGFPSTENRKFNATTLPANILHWPYIRKPQHRRKYPPFFMKLHSNLCPYLAVKEHSLLFQDIIHLKATSSSPQALSSNTGNSPDIVIL